MNQIQISFDHESFNRKPATQEIPVISNRIAKHCRNIQLTGMRQLAEDIGSHGHTFCPATFKDGIRRQDHFEQQQMFVLDFDNDNPKHIISFEKLKSRAEQYDLPVLFAYDTFSSVDHNRFRVVFLNDSSITHSQIAKAMLLAMGEIFPEADSSCYTDVSKLYFGGKKLLHYDEALPTINVESVFRGLTCFMKDKYKDNHYKEYLSRFSSMTEIALTKNGLPDVTSAYQPIEFPGASKQNEDGKNSPNSIIYTANIKGNGEIFRNKYYRINIRKKTESTGKSSVTTSGAETDVVHKKHKNHSPYRSSDMTLMYHKCRLFNDFATGKRDMRHDELFGLATNLIQIETGSKRFQEIQSENPNIYDDARRRKWSQTLSYIKQQEYNPQGCEGYCPYYGECSHGRNILSTIHPKPGVMERVPGYSEAFFPIEEVQDDTYDAISRAYRAVDSKVHIIKSMTGAGKSYSYLKLMKENPQDRFLIATPTNLLKDEIYEKADLMGIKVKETPSLEQIKDEIPSEIYEKIQWFYKSGHHKLVHPYITKCLESEKIECLQKYMEEREAIQQFHGNVITTHRYLLNMEEERLREFDVIIIDEDILFKSIISNQGEITISQLKKLLKKSTDIRVSQKIKKLLKKAKNQVCIKLDSFELEDEDDDDDSKKPFDLASFCLAEHFYLRKASEEEHLEKDTVAFLKPADFKDVSYIMVSATANEEICRQYFENNNVEFYECKTAKYQGTLHQYTRKSMSRTSIRSDPGIIQRLMNRFGIDEEQVITFMKENIGTLHFGNTEGSNTLEGEDILVVGTPYHAEFLYKLTAFSMGPDFNEDEKMSLQLVEYNGYRFHFTTFENENLRTVQFWMIESELEQAVGRARLLRNTCNVHLFSNFPLSQAEIIQDFDYNKE